MIRLGFAFLVWLAWSAPTRAQLPPPPPTPTAGALEDGGLLDPAWFGPEVHLVPNPDVDFLWIQPGLDLRGQTLHVREWSEPHLLDPHRDARDLAAATRLTDTLPALFRGALRGAFEGKATISRTGGRFAWVGRLVDANAGPSLGGRMTSSSGNCWNATWDLKLVDPATGRAMVAVHHRVLRGNAGSMEERFGEWVDQFSRLLVARTLR